MNKPAKIALWTVAALAVSIGSTLLLTLSPQARAKSQARNAIEVCRDEQKRFNGASGHRSVINATCETLINDFILRYNHAP